jgi:hypothetical protein
VIRPSGKIAVASTMILPQPLVAIDPRCTKCQSVNAPSSAESESHQLTFHDTPPASSTERENAEHSHSHIGATHARFLNSCPLIVMGVNSRGGFSFCGNLSAGKRDPMPFC